MKKDIMTADEVINQIHTAVTFVKQIRKESLWNILKLKYFTKRSWYEKE